MIAALRQALAKRESLFKDPNNNAFRLFSGEREGVPGLVVEKYDHVLIGQFHEGKCRLSQEELGIAAEFLLETTGCKSFYLKTFVADRSGLDLESTPRDKSAFRGDNAQEEFPIRENGLTFLIRPYDGFSTGLFLDQRLNRPAVTSDLRGKTFLNGFAYTCGFSVYAAVSGAKVTSVDLSRKYLEWGKRNYEANNLSLAAHAFVAEDIFEFFKLAQKRGATFDRVVLDPPTFSRNKNGDPFSVKKDFPRLFEAVWPLVAPEGKLYFSSNLSTWTSADLQDAVEGMALPVTIEPLPEVPLDFQSETSSLAKILVSNRV